MKVYQYISKQFNSIVYIQSHSLGGEILLTSADELSLNLKITADNRSISIFATAVSSLAGRLQGLLGNFDGHRDNDLIAMRGSQPITYSLSGVSETFVHKVMSTC